MEVITDNNLHRALVSAVQIGYMRCQEALGMPKRYVNQRWATDKFGIRRVREWERMGWVKPRKSGDAENSTILYSYEELLAADCTSSENNNKGCLTDKNQ